MGTLLSRVVFVEPFEGENVVITFARQLSIAVAVFLSGVSHCVGQPAFQPATTVQQPTFGVRIDAAGVLNSAKFAEAGDPLFRQRALVARRKLSQDIMAYSKLRKISLRRLSEEMDQTLQAGAELDDSILKLAGLLRLQYVFILPAERDIVLAGPAEGWMPDAADRTVGLTTGLPTLLLDDLLVALQAYAPDQPRDKWVGCTINPKPDALSRLAEFNRTSPSVVRQAAQAQTAVRKVQGMRSALGLADIIVFGIAPETNMARVLVEADYRMKMIAVGLEPPPIPMATFMGSLQYPPPRSFQRWWFTPDYQAVALSPDKTSLGIVGDSVQLLTEDYDITKSGQLYKTGKNPSGPAATYAKTFTKQYPRIARMSPVFQQLRNAIDMLVVAAFLRQERVLERVDLQDSCFMDPTISLASNGTEPLQAACVANAIWKRQRLIAIAGGGVSIQARQALDAENLVEANGELDKIRELCLPDTSEPDQWWWD